MTLRTNSRIAGITFLLYIAVALPSMLLSAKATRGEGTAAKLAGIAQNAPQMRLVIVLSLLSCFAALVLAVTLFAITRDEDPDLALLGFSCRLGEGLIGGAQLVPAVGLLWLATGADGAAPTGSAGVHVLAAFLMKAETWGVTISATFFAVGSTVFSYLFLRGRIVPVPLAWLGVLASVLVVVLLPLQLAGLFAGPLFDLMWYPMLVFEVVLALWLIVKGARPARRAVNA
jgi:hypothetical protein